MAFEIKRVEYYEMTVEGHIGEGAKLLSVFADLGVNLLAFKTVTLAPVRIRFTLVPDDGVMLHDGAKKAGLNVDGPHAALFIKGDTDEPGELAKIYTKLSLSRIPVRESSGIADIKGSYGVILYLAQEDCENAMAALEM